MRNALAVLLLAVLTPGGLAAQAFLRPGTTMQVLPGTTLRIPDSLTLDVGPGASLVNDGAVVLAPTAAVAEVQGSPITGTGTERIDLVVTAPPAGLEPGGLGFTLAAALALDSLTVLRGHTVLADTSGASGIARWYRVTAQVNTGLAAEIGLRYDPTELQGIAEADLMIYTARQGDSIWLGLPSAVNMPQTTVSAFLLDSLGTFTLFDGSLGTHVQDSAPAAGLHAGPVPATDHLELLDHGPGFRGLTVLDATGRVVLRQDLAHRTQRHIIPLAALPAGAYVLRTDDGRSLRFLHP